MCVRAGAIHMARGIFFVGVYNKQVRYIWLKGTY